MTALADVPDLRPGTGPLLCAARREDLAARRRLERAWTRGDLVRLAAGVYLPASTWTALSPWDRSTASAAALALARPATVFTGLTAARLRRLPVAVDPPALDLRATSPGHRGAAPLTSRPFSPALLAAGGRLPRPPRRRPRWGLPQAPGMAPEPVEIRLSDGTGLGWGLADASATLLLVLGAATPFRNAVAPLDVLLATHPEAQSWAQAAEEALPTRAARERFERTWSFAAAGSESAGESYSRALMHELGFAAPTALQHRHRDATGREVARTDFWWADARVAGEFDGIGKYDLGLHRGDDAARRASIRREKEREVALQLVTRAVAHWTWEDLRAPERLARILTAAGVPRTVCPEPTDAQRHHLRAERR